MCHVYTFVHCVSCVHIRTLCVMRTHSYTVCHAYTFIHCVSCVHIRTLCVMRTHSYTVCHAYTFIHCVSCVHIQEQRPLMWTVHNHQCIIELDLGSYKKTHKICTVHAHRDYILSIYVSSSLLPILEDS